MSKTKHYLQIDLLKAYAIISVIILHALLLTDLIKILHLPQQITVSLYYLTIGQAVPIFLLIMGRNTGDSFFRRNYKKLSEIFTYSYFKARFERIILPFLFIYFLSIIIVIFINFKPDFNILAIIGYLPLPIPSPGNYFISLIFEFIIIFPFLYVLFKYNSKLMLLISFLITFLFEILAYQTQIVVTDPYLYNSCIIRYLFVISLGLWTVKHVDFSKITSNILLLICILFSTVYLVIYSCYGWGFPYFSNGWGAQNVLTSFYPLLIFLVGMRFLPQKSNNIILNFVGLIGKASYHIFLLQILFFGLVKLNDTYGYSNIIILIFNYDPLISLIICLIFLITAGILFLLIENKFLAAIRNANIKKFKTRH